MVEVPNPEQNTIQSQLNSQVVEHDNINDDNKCKELKEDILGKLAERKYQDMKELDSFPKIRKNKNAKEMIRLANKVVREIKQMQQMDIDELNELV